MKTVTKSLKALCAVALLAGSGLATSAQAQTSLSDVINAINRDSSQMSAEDNERVARFQREFNEQESAMDGARAELRAAQARASALNSEYDSNEVELDTLATELEIQSGDFGELLGQFRTAAGETMPIIEDSLANFEYPGRVERLSEISQARALPTREDLDALPNAILQEMVAQSEVKTFSGTVAGAGPDGGVADKELLRIGVFGAATTDDAAFVEVNDGVNPPILQQFAAQPSGKFRSSMKSLINAGPGETVIVPFDPSKGNLFAIEGEKLSLTERIAQGKTVGYIILVLLTIGLLFALFKIVTLFLMGNSMRGTAKTKAAGDGNPLARVFEVYETNKGEDLETLELKLDEQILRESPKIERFNDVIKVLAAVAPLLGLLGTVIGMINTFTAITNFGTGDPRLMADGISEALVTTVLGLCAAIPLLLTHAVASALARGNQQILDEQSAGLVAERAEGSGGA
ncbi:MAG: MotA/TolQ/ExbB proton channel family protein [Pseudomonadota bacterium]